MHRSVALVVLVSILIPTGRLYAIEFVEDFNDPSRAPGYAFEGYKFGDGNFPWTVQGLSAGGVNNTGCSQVTAVNRDQDDCWYGLTLNDGDFYWAHLRERGGPASGWSPRVLAAANMWGTSEVSDPVWFIKV